MRLVEDTHDIGNDGSTDPLPVFVAILRMRRLLPLVPMVPWYPEVAPPPSGAPYHAFRCPACPDVFSLLCWH
jgi:hypothetical protein